MHSNMYNYVNAFMRLLPKLLTLTQKSVYYKIKDNINVVINLLWLSNCTRDKQTEQKPRE